MQQHESESAPVYRIAVAGRLTPAWAEWFGGMRITPTADGATLIEGPVADQAALYALLRKVRDLGLPLLAVNRVAPDRDLHPD
jgi:hypothetical protein